MTPHVHVGAVEFLTVVAYVLIFTFLWRMAAAALVTRKPGLAAGMTAVYS